MTTAPAQVVNKKRKLVEKSKLKKITKNILCKPDHDFWPTLTEEQSLEVAALISKHKIKVPEFIKLPWSKLKNIPKEERPKEKRVQNVPGFKFGMTSSVGLIKNKKCKCLLVDNDISPRILVSHIIQLCVDDEIPVVCVKSLKKTATAYFGFPSACIAIDDTPELIELKETVSNFGARIKHIMKNTVRNEDKDIIVTESDIDKVSIKNMDIDEPVQKKEPFEYLIRTSNKYRVFVPPSSEEQVKVCKEFTGQNYIKLGENANKDNKLSYKGMIVKRFSGNTNRKKHKNKKNKK